MLHKLIAFVSIYPPDRPLTDAGSISQTLSCADGGARRRICDGEAGGRGAMGGERERADTVRAGSWDRPESALPLACATGPTSGN